ncbi:MAG: DUF5597 domain-containing protein [Massilia sp.]
MKKTIGSILLVCGAMLAAPAMAQQAPHLEKRGQATQLIVDGKPFIVLGGELHNSSSSSLDYLDPLWAPLKQQNLNTALVAVSWELIEPSEGKYDFSLVDGMLKGARANDLKVVLLWFGSWKNGLSHYTPEWVKKDGKRFPRIQLENGRATETITALSEEAARADARAFAALMRHVKQVDATKHTVIMVQVENEVGVIGGTRDHSPMANAAFAKPVPAQLMDSLAQHRAQLQPQLKALWEGAGGKTSGSWSQVFGATPAADEAFSAWHYARYINQVAAAGKAEYALPMFVNAWLVQPDDKKPGDYPGGGPQSHSHDIWRAGAPALDFFSPDIYLADTKGIAALYHHPWNPLFIPESFNGADGAANAFYVIGRHSGLGYSPFGIDAKVDKPRETPIAKAYSVLAQLTPEIAAAQAAGSITAFTLDKSAPLQSAELGGYRLSASLRKNWNGVVQVDKAYALVIHSGPDMFTVAGADIDLTFEPITAGPKQAGIASLREGRYDKGVWKPGRLLNGDNIMISYKLADEAAANRSGTGVRLLTEPSIAKVKLYRFE